MTVAKTAHNSHYSDHERIRKACENVVIKDLEMRRITIARRKKLPSHRMLHDLCFFCPRHKDGVR